MVREVREAINKVKTSKGYGIDGICRYCLKLALPFIEHSLVLVFNKSLGTASFPDSRKLRGSRQYSKMIKGREIELSSYLHASRHFEALRKDSFQYKSQSSVKEMFSTDSCLPVNVDDWYKGIDTGHYKGFIFIDLKMRLIL